MADAHDKIMAMIEKELAANPDIENAELKKKAERIDGSVGKLNARQFNARYPLQVKRRMNPPKRRRRAASKGGRARGGRGGGNRETVRAVLLDFARDVAAAEGKAQIVDLIAGVDRYVDRVVKAKG